jgi:hypothetical protein
MWVSKANDWHGNHTDLTKYFFEKVKQQVDFEEVISNRHRTTNGHTLIAEIIEVASMTLKRKKSYRRLASLISECLDKNLSNNILNDFILNKYHQDVIAYYKDIANRIKDDNSLIKDIQLKSKVNLARLDDDYIQNLYFEITSLDFQSTKFLEVSKKIDEIVNCLIPSLLHVGYSPTSISDIAYRMVRKESGVSSPENFAKHFNKHQAEYEFLVIAKANSPELNEQLELFDDLDISYNHVNYTYVRKLIDYGRLDLNSDQVIFQLNQTCIDPHNFLRSIYERSIRYFVLSKNRESLSYFNDFFENIYWRFTKTNMGFQPSNIKVDPINIRSRENTLIATLKLLSEDYDFKFNGKLPNIQDLSDSVYFYNLGLGSKSIENSLMLLWSSLESLIPYRFHSNDIENIQYFVSKSLSLGSIGRRVTSFAKRLIQTEEFDRNLDFRKLGIQPELSFFRDKFTYWPFWLADDSKIHSSDDPYDVIKASSNMLCKQYTELNMLFSGHKYVYKVDALSQMIDSSKTSIEYQLDRIYLHRNQIVHSGKFINEYSNLWTHLEWYVGKLLSYCFFKHYIGDFSSKENAFLELEADFDLLTNLLKNHENKKVSEIQFAFKKIFEHTWQFQ